VGVGWRFRSPCRRFEMFDQNLIHAIIGGEDLERGSTGLSVKLGLTRGHGSCSLSLLTDNTRSS
jgi:hypothetical protein